MESSLHRASMMQLIRPPVTVVREVLYFARDVFLSFLFQRVISELPRPITAKLRQMIAACVYVYFIN